MAKLSVQGQLPDDFKESFVKRIQLRAFQPLTPEEDVEERIGWTAISSPLDLELSHENVFYNSYLNLGLRVDKWRLPSTILKAHVVAAQRERLEKTGKERLSKTEKDEILARVSLRLKKKLMPTMRAFDFSWNLDTMTAWFWSQSPRTVEMLSVLFEQTFGLELVLHSPYIAATELDLTKSERAALSAVEATPFHAARRKEKEG